MAIYRKTCDTKGCENTAVVELFGKHSHREWVLENHTHICEDCEKIQEKKQEEKNESSMKEFEVNESLPELEGASDKQIQFARDLRKQVFEREKGTIERHEYKGLEGRALDRAKKAIEFFQSETRANRVINFCKRY